jgi:hypothetical protein
MITFLWNSVPEIVEGRSLSLPKGAPCACRRDRAVAPERFVLRASCFDKLSKLSKLN